MKSNNTINRTNSTSENRTNSSHANKAIIKPADRAFANLSDRISGGRFSKKILTQKAWLTNSVGARLNMQIVMRHA